VVPTPHQFPIFLLIFGPTTLLPILVILSTAAGFVGLGIVFWCVLALATVGWPVIVAFVVWSRLRAKQDSGGWTVGDVLLRGIFIHAMILIATTLACAPFLMY
jgi:hypothetical protein